MKPELLLITHVPSPHLGWLPQWLSEHFFIHEVVAEDFFSKIPHFLPDHVAIMGGPMGVSDQDKYPWLSKEIKWVSEIITEKKLLGICLGAQIIAASLGATISSCVNGRMECGYYKSHSRKLPGFIYHWHRDGIVLPPHLEGYCLGSSPWRAHLTTQGFAFKNTLALQFHPEVDDELIVRWLERKKEDLGEIGTRPAETHLADHEKYGQEVKEWLKKALSKQWKMPLAA